MNTETTPQQPVFNAEETLINTHLETTNPTGLISKNINKRWEAVSPQKITVGYRQRKIQKEHVTQLKQSFKALGGRLQLQPIIVDSNYELIDGAHRLQAVKELGWELIQVVVLEDLEKFDKDLLEAEANRVRLQLSPLELQEAWENIYAPAIKQQAAAKRTLALQQPESSVTQLLGNDNQQVLNTRDEAKKATGLSLPTLEKIAAVKLIAEDPASSQNIKQAAVKALEHLAKPGASVNTAYKAVMKLREKEALAELGEKQAALERSHAILAALAEELTHMYARLTQPATRQALKQAVSTPTGLEDLTAVANTANLIVETLASIQDEATASRTQPLWLL